MLMHKKPNTPRTVYLDQNIWIYLSRAYYQQPGEIQYATTLQKVRGAVKQQTARFPFSNIHVLETMKHGDLSRRRKLAQVMAEISEGWSIAPQEKITPVEFNMAIPRAFNKPFLITTPLVFGRGIEFAFGEPVHTKEIIDSLDSPIEMKRRMAIQFLAIILSSPDESLRKPAIDKYNAATNTFADQTDQIRKLVRNRNKDYRHRAFTARPIFEHLRDRKDELIALLAPLGFTVEDLFNLGKDAVTALYEDMPTMDVMVNLGIQRKDEFEKVISSNDLHDFSFLSVAIPYCDIVVTEKKWVALAKRKGFDQKYNTILLSDLEDLKDYL